MNLPQTGEVLTPCGWKRYINPRMTKKNAPLVKVEFVGGYSVKCTPDHLFLTESGWKSAESLTQNTAILSSLTKSRSISTGRFIEYGRLIGISLKVAAGYIEMFGRRLSALFRQIVISITAIATQQTTCLKIWNARTHLSIYRIAGQNVPETQFHPQQEQGLLLGMDQKRAGCGTNNMQKELKAGQSGSTKISLANTAARYLAHWCERAGTQASIAMSIARSPRTECAGKPTNTPLLIERVRQLNETADVWDITVPDGHCFSLENGAVVHNSDAFGLMCIAYEEQTVRRIDNTPEWIKEVRKTRGVGFMGA